MPKSARTRILALPLPAVLALPAETALAAKDDTVLVSRASDGTAGNGESLFADVSANGRYVAFHSSADNLSTEDDDAVINVYVRDLVTGTTTLVSRATDGTPADGDSTEPPNETTTLVSRASGALGAPAAADATEPSVSGDGRRVAFHSAASNLVAGDNNPTLDVFVRDLTTATTTVASAATGSSSPAGGVRPAISGDGRHVAFDTTSDDVSDEDRDATVDVYPRDLATGTTMLVSRRSGAAGDPGDANSSHAAIADGAATVAFHSVADTLADDDDNAATNVFARRR